MRSQIWSSFGIKIEAFKAEICPKPFADILLSKIVDVNQCRRGFTMVTNGITEWAMGINKGPETILYLRLGIDELSPNWRAQNWNVYPVISEYPLTCTYMEKKHQSSWHYAFISIPWFVSPLDGLRLSSGPSWIGQREQQCMQKVWRIRFLF